MLIHHIFLVFNLLLNKSTGEMKDGQVKKGTADYMHELSSDVKQQLFKYDFNFFISCVNYCIIKQYTNNFNK